MKRKLRWIVPFLMLTSLPVALATGETLSAEPPGPEECFPKKSVFAASRNAGDICVEKDAEGMPVRRGEYHFTITTDEGRQDVTSVQLRSSKDMTLAELNCIASVLRETKWEIEPHCAPLLELMTGYDPPEGMLESMQKDRKDE